MSEDKRDGWRSIDSAPYAKAVRVKTKGGRVLRASFQAGLMDDMENECGGWFAEDEDEQPPCWTDGICWASNADGVPSDPPTHWLPDPPAT